MLYYGPADDAEGALSIRDRFGCPPPFSIRKAPAPSPFSESAGAVFLRQPPEYAFVNFSIAVAIFF